MILHIECRALLNTWGLSVGYNIAAFILALGYEKIPLSCAARVFFTLVVGLKILNALLFSSFIFGL
jgi:hypothetical protein